MKNILYESEFIQYADDSTIYGSCMELCNVNKWYGQRIK